MRDGPDDLTVAGALQWRPLVSSWLDGVLLADLIPVTTGQVEVDVTQNIPERLTFTVPEWASGQSWIPTDALSPLASFGQIVFLSVVVSAPVSGLQWVIRIGTYQIRDWEFDDVAGTVVVECTGLLQIPNDDTFTTPVVPRAADTFVSMMTRLMPDGLPVNFDDSLTDRALPQSFQWDTDTTKLAAIYDVADAWPARVRVDQYGTVQILPPLSDAPDTILTLQDGPKGTLAAAPTSGSRDGIYNVVPVSAAQTDNPSLAPIKAVATVSGGPLDPSTYGRVVAPTFTSPLITSQAMANATAATKLQESTRGALSRAAQIMPDPRVDIDDAVQVWQHEQALRGELVTRGYVNGYTLPLVVTDGAMTVNVGSEVWS